MRSDILKSLREVFFPTMGSRYKERVLLAVEMMLSNSLGGVLEKRFPALRIASCASCAAVSESFRETLHISLNRLDRAPEPSSSNSGSGAAKSPTPVSMLAQSCRHGSRPMDGALYSACRIIPV